MGHVLTLVDVRVVVIAVALTAAAAGASIVQDRTRGRGWLVFSSLLAFIVVLLMTIANRGVVVSDEGLAYDLTWWSRNWDDLVPMATGSGFWWHWWLNIALFVPAGLSWAVLTRRPRFVLLVSFGIVLLIETLHATVLSGAGDPTDVIANMIGASAGVGAASLWTQKVCAGEQQRSRTSRGAKTPVDLERS